MRLAVFPYPGVLLVDVRPGRRDDRPFCVIAGAEEPDPTVRMADRRTGWERLNPNSSGDPWSAPAPRSRCSIRTASSCVAARRLPGRALIEATDAGRHFWCCAAVRDGMKRGTL